MGLAKKKDPLLKPQTYLIPYEALIVEAQAMAYGAYVKYDEWDWIKGRPYTQVLSSVDHHIRAWSEHEIYDPESKCHHLGLARCNLAMLIAWEAMNKEGLDNRRPICSVTIHKPTL